jgi:lysophospholipase L1-like esterase
MHTEPFAQRIRKGGRAILIFAMIVLSLDVIWVVFFGGVRLKVGNFVLRSTTIEFPAIALLISFFCFLLLKGKWKESILLVGSLSFACLIGEGVLRFVDHPWSQPFIDVNAWQQPSDVLGFTMVPNFEGRGPLDLPIKTNAQGFRDDGEHAWTKPPGVIRILGIGDSFTFGWGVSLEESFLKKLEGNLKKLTGLNIETINSGVPGWNLNHYYVYYKEIGVRYSPDIVVLSCFFNDVPKIVQETIPADDTHRKGVKHTGGIFRFSYLFNFFKSLAHNIRIENRYKRFDYMYELGARRKRMVDEKRFMLYDPGPDRTQANTAVIKTLLEKIQSLAKKHGSQLVMTYIPDVSQPQYPEWQHINRVWASLTTELNIPFIDMTPVFESASDPRAFYFWPKDFHTNALGHEKIAEALTPLLCQALQQQNIQCAGTDSLAQNPQGS